MPGLLRGVARTAVVAGTATAVSNRVSRKQASKWSQEEQAQAPAEETAAAPAQTEDDTFKQLEQLGQLKADGILTEEEFTAKKKQILGL
ncbi:MAG: hypothetical protein QG658_311 [Patescibacteria group bacterium]|jgi:hypothetical protein|nr:hypothetical protein [Patescibacteria group bacterium]